MKTLWIPVAGTLAAALAVVVARATEEARRGPPPPPLFDREPVPPSAPAPRHTLLVERNGALFHKESAETFRSVEELLGRIAPPGARRPRVRVEAGPGVDAERVAEIAEALRERCDVEALPGEAEGK